MWNRSYNFRGVYLLLFAQASHNISVCLSNNLFIDEDLEFTEIILGHKNVSSKTIRDYQRISRYLDIYFLHNSLTNDKIFVWSKLKAFLYNISNSADMMIISLGM